MKIQPTLTPRAIGQDLKGFLKSLVGSKLNLFVKSVDFSGKSALVQLQSRSFLANLDSVHVKPGSILQVLVESSNDGPIRLVVKESVLSRLSIGNLKADQIPFELKGLLSLFFGDVPNPLINDLLKSKKNNKKVMAKWIALFKDQLKTDTGYAKSMDLVLDSLHADSSSKNSTLMDTAHQEAFQMQSDHGNGQNKEDWEFHCFGQSKKKPGYYFFYAKTGLSGTISGSIVSEDPLFQKISLLIRFESPKLNAFFQNNKQTLIHHLKQSNIDLEEIVFLDSGHSSNLDLRA